MGTCVLKECGFQLTKKQMKKEKMFKEQLKEQYFAKIIDEHAENNEKIYPNIKINDEPNNLENYEKDNKINFSINASHIKILENSIKSEKTKAKEETDPAITDDKKNKKILKPALKIKKNNNFNNINDISKEKEEIEEIQSVKQGNSPKSNIVFQNKLFVNEKFSSDAENLGNNFEKIFNEDLDSDDENYIEKLFPQSSFKISNK